MRTLFGKSISSVGVVALLGACLYLTFELGRYRAGFSLLDYRSQTESLTEQIADRDAQIESLQRRQAILETAGDIDAETYAAVEGQLTELQDRIQALEEELAFYQGIVTPGDGVAGLRIQSVEVSAPQEGLPHVLSVLLVQAIVHNDRVAGAVRVRVSGRIGAETRELGLGELTPDGAVAEIPYGFRYFQRLEQGFELPQGFEPETIEIEVWPKEPRGDPVSQSYPWAQVSS